MKKICICILTLLKIKKSLFSSSLVSKDYLLVMLIMVDVFGDKIITITQSIPETLAASSEVKRHSLFFLTLSLKQHCFGGKVHNNELKPVKEESGHDFYLVHLISLIYGRWNYYHWVRVH